MSVEHLIPWLLVTTKNGVYGRVPKESAFAHSLGAHGFSFFYGTCSVETESGVSMRGGKKMLFSSWLP